jgi:hypothetical protein
MNDACPGAAGGKDCFTMLRRGCAAPAQLPVQLAPGEG